MTSTIENPLISSLILLTNECCVAVPSRLCCEAVKLLSGPEYSPVIFQPTFIFIDCTCILLFIPLFDIFTVSNQYF